MKRILVAGLLVMLSVSGLFSQPQHSIHYQQWLEHSNIPKQPSLFNPSGSDIQARQGLPKRAPQKTIFGYLPDWEYKKARKYLQYDLLTHIAAFDFGVNADGSIGNPSYWPWTDVINEAHAHGVRVVMVAVNFDADEIHALLTDSTVKSNFFKNVQNKISTYHLDGINIDFEGLYSADRGSLLNAFMADLTGFVHEQFPSSEVSFAGPAVNWGGWKLAGLADACDYIFIMGYAFYGGWSGTSGPGAPLSGGSYNITNTVEVQYKQITDSQPQKLILGLPYYGSRWQTEDGSAYSGTIQFIGATFFTTEMKEAINYGIQWDSRSQTPWYFYRIGTDWYQVWFDTDSSLDLKYELADSKNYRGVGMWALGYDDDRSELWNELRKRYAPGTLPLPDPPQGFFITNLEGSDSVFIHLDAQDFVDGYRIYWGSDGITFSDSMDINGNQAEIGGFSDGQLYYFKCKAKNGCGLSAASGVLAATVTPNPVTVLIVDGFDRNSPGNTYNFIRQHAAAFSALGYAVVSAQNEALMNGTFDPNDFFIVDWFLGDESTVDFTFNVPEQAVVKEYLRNGGHLFVSGSEIGWDLVHKGSVEDRQFYEDFLKAHYVDDAPLGKRGTYYQAEAVPGQIFAGVSSFYFDDGNHATYDVDYPDAISAMNGSNLALKYNNVSSASGGAAVSFSGMFPNGRAEGKVVNMSIPFETIYPAEARREVLAKIVDFFNKATPVAQYESAPPGRFRLFPNYPNPFGAGARGGKTNNPQTMIRFQIPSASPVRLTVYNILGQVVKELLNTRMAAGRHRIVFNATGLAGGVYVVKIEAGRFSATEKVILIR